MPEVRQARFQRGMLVASNGLSQPFILSFSKGGREYRIRDGLQ